ncbi:hypothetical protein CDL15_Pgr000581 [Punica granatum]|uniref:Uncharacterized protein n=1 Tax=Punica granatum TaxID=22663 RepID=A0A218W3L8_PUNGR|nr:hypothetical protein CDL15_Pgr000581 [Punica granatum]
MIEMWKKKQNLFGILYSWFLAKVASKLEVFPGNEFRVAFEEAMKYGGRVILGDRPVQVPTVGEMIEMWKKKQNLFGILYSWFLAKVASKLEVFPGNEFRVAFEEAMKYGGRVILGDRPVQVVFRHPKCGISI